MKKLKVKGEPLKVTEWIYHAVENNNVIETEFYFDHIVVHAPNKNSNHGVRLKLRTTLTNNEKVVLVFAAEQTFLFLDPISEVSIANLEDLVTIMLQNYAAAYEGRNPRPPFDLRYPDFTPDVFEEIMRDLKNER